MRCDCCGIDSNQGTSVTIAYGDISSSTRYGGLFSTIDHTTTTKYENMRQKSIWFCNDCINKRYKIKNSPNNLLTIVAIIGFVIMCALTYFWWDPVIWIFVIPGLIALVCAWVAFWGIIGFFLNLIPVQLSFNEKEAFELFNNSFQSLGIIPQGAGYMLYDEFKKMPAYSMKYY